MLVCLFGECRDSEGVNDAASQDTKYPEMPAWLVTEEGGNGYGSI